MPVDPVLEETLASRYAAEVEKIRAAQTEARDTARLMSTRIDPATGKDVPVPAGFSFKGAPVRQVEYPDPEAFAKAQARDFLAKFPDAPDSDLEQFREWSERAKALNAVRTETAANADRDVTSAAGSAFNATVVPFATEANRALLDIPGMVSRNVTEPIVSAVTGLKAASPKEVQAAEAQGREAHPFVSGLSSGVGATTGAMTLVAPAAGVMTPVLTKVGMSPGVAATVASLLAGAAHGGAVEGTVEGAIRTGVYMGGAQGLGRVLRGATPGAARYLASEATAGATASVLSQLATEGHADPTRVLADGVVNALFGVGGARAASRAKAQAHVAAEVAKGREIPEIVNDDVFKAMWEESRTYPDPTAEAAATRGEYDARLADVEGQRPAIPAIDPVAEAKATAAEFDAKVAPESAAPEKPVSVAPVAPVAPPDAAPPSAPEATAPKGKTLIGKDKRGQEVWEINGNYYTRSKRGPLGAAHPESVAEAKASATPDVAPATPDVAAPPVDPVKQYAAKPGYQERSVYNPAAGRPAKPGPEAKTLAKALDAEADSVQHVLNKEASGQSLYPQEAALYHRIVQHRMDNPPVSKPGKQGERGALSLAPVGELIGEVATGAQRVFGETLTRVRSFKTPAAEEAYKKGVEAADAAKAYRGEMGRELLAAEKLTGQAPVTKYGRAATNLSTPTKAPGKSYTEPTLYDVIEGRRPPASPEEARIVDVLRKVIWKTGEVTEAAGLQQQDASGNFAPFVNRTDKIAPRMTTPDYMEIVRSGSGSRAWQPMIDAFADINPGIPRANIETYFKDLHNDMTVEGPQAAGSKAQAEFTRGFPRVPATIEVGGRTVRLFETNAATYIRRLVETRALRLGFVKAFGQDVPGVGSPVQNLRERFTKETNKPEEFVNMTRLLHGHAKDAPFIDPASISGGVARNIGRLWSGAREMLLSASAVVNVPESLGATQHMVGTRRLGQAIVRAFKGRKDAVNDVVDALGATTRDAVNLSYDPANPRGSASRMFSEAMTRLTGRRFVEEFQERVAAVGGKLMADDMKAGKGTDYDVQSLKTMGWDDADARRIAAGRGTQAEYDAVTRKVPSEAVGANKSRAENSWLQNTRALKPLNFIASYAHNIIRNTASVHKAFVDTMGRVIDGSGLTPKQRWAGTFRAFQHLTGFYASKTLQGSAAALLGAVVTGNKDIAVAEMKDDPFAFAVKNFVMATVGGPYAAAARSLFGDGNAAQISPPVAIGLDVMDAIQGDGKYRDLPTSERFAKLAERMIPATRIARTGAVLIGLASEESQDIDNARSAYWRWRKDFDKRSFTSTEAQTEEEKSYRTALKSAYLDMTRGKDPEEVAKRVLLAVGGDEAIGKDRKKAASSIRRRKLLDNDMVKPRLDALKKRIGDKAYKALESHDSLLESLADSVQRGG